MDSPIAGVSDEDVPDSPIAGVSDDDLMDSEAARAFEKSNTNSTREDLSCVDSANASDRVTVPDSAVVFSIAKEPAESTEDMNQNHKRNNPDEDDDNISRKKVCSELFVGEILTITAKGGKIIQFPVSSVKKPSSLQLLASSIDELHNEVALKRSEKENVTENVHCNRSTGDQLWVDKYAPKNFLHLLSDERCNRNVLQWLKLWDPVVFGKTVKGNSIAKKNFGEDSVIPPESQILLLNGPPGVGKTTLAHILARQAGYTPMEINASDERSAASLKARLEALMETQSIDGKNGRPVCVILDEVDGTLGSEGQGAIGMLLKLVSGETTSQKKKKTFGDADGEDNAQADEESLENETDKSAAKRRKKVKKTIRRPIICICNDLYATPLRPLRKVAQVVKFSAPSSGKMESIRMDRQALTLLYEIHHGDIRACVTALQMIMLEPVRENAVIDAAKLRRLVLASARDGGMSSGLFEVWNAIFDQSAGKKSQAAIAGNKPSSSGEHKDTDKSLHRILEAHTSDMNVILNGCHHNYPNVKYTDPHLYKTTACLEALCDADCMQTKIQSQQNYALLPHLPFAARRIHLACATSAQVNVEFPHAITKYSQAQKERRAILDAIRTNFRHDGVAIDGCNPTPTRQPATILVTETLPALSSVLNPEFRASNIHVVSKETKEQMERHVAIMRTYGLSYHSAQRSSQTVELEESNTASFKIEPDIEDLITFPKPLSASEIGINAVPSNQTAVPARSSLSQDLMKYLQQMLERGSVGASAHGRSAGQKNKAEAQKICAAQEINAKQKRFGQAGWASASQHKSCREVAGRPNQSAAHGVKYKFNEGVTNAIKRPVMVRDLF